MDERFARLRFTRLVLWPILAGALVIAARFILPARPSFGAMATVVAYTFYGVLWIAALTACRRAGIRTAEIVGPTPQESHVWIKTAFLAPLVLTFSAVALVLTLSLGDLIAPGWAERQSERDSIDLLTRLGSAWRLPLLLVAVAFAPIIEEFVFRGMLLKRWAATRGLWTGILGSAAIFALLHPPTWIGAFVFGIVAGILYLWSGSLLAPILMHVLNNTFVALALTFGDRGSDQEAAALNVGATAVVVAGVMLLVIGSAIVAVVRPLVGQIRSTKAG